MLVGARVGAVVGSGVGLVGDGVGEADGPTGLGVGAAVGFCVTVNVNTGEMLTVEGPVAHPPQTVTVLVL